MEDIFFQINAGNRGQIQTKIRPATFGVNSQRQLPLTSFENKTRKGEQA
jgi:hypothetical protein